MTANYHSHTHTAPPHPPEALESAPGQVALRACKSESWLIHLRAEGDGPPPIIRLRRWLKIGLRSYGLKCTRISEISDKRSDTNPPAKTVTGEGIDGCDFAAMDMTSVGAEKAVKR